MHVKSPIIAVMLLLCVSITGNANGQLVRKAGQFLAGKVFRETAKETTEQGTKLVLRKAGTEAVKQTAKTGLRQVAGGTVAKTAMSQSGKLVVSYGDDAAKAMAKLSPQNSRRLAMMADDIGASGQGSRLMKLIAEGGDADKVVNFLWRNKGTIVGGAVLTTLITNPDAVLGASGDVVTGLADAGGEYIAKPAIEHVAGPVIHWLGFTLGLLCLSGTVVAYYRF